MHVAIMHPMDLSRVPDARHLGHLIQAVVCNRVEGCYILAYPRNMFFAVLAMRSANLWGC